MADGQQPDTSMESSKGPIEASKTRHQPVTSKHVKLKRSQRHENSIKLRPWLPDYCTGALLVVAGVHDAEVLAKDPRSFDGSDALDRTVQGR